MVLYHPYYSTHWVVYTVLRACYLQYKLVVYDHQQNPRYATAVHRGLWDAIFPDNCE